MVLGGGTTNTVNFQAPAVTGASEVVKLQLVVRDLVQASDPAIIDVVVKNPGFVEVPPMPKGCGCTSGFELLPLLALGLMFRGRRRQG